MEQFSLILADLAAVSILVFALYFPRYRRKEMVVAILGLNVGVLAVATALSSAEVSAGLGLGLFGVLSIIRLRSSELDQEEVAYYFTALAIGLLGGISISPVWLTPVLMATILAALYIGDHPQLFARSRNQVITLGRAHTDESALISHVEAVLDAKVYRVKVKRLDLVNDTTTIDVRYRIHSNPGSQGQSVESTELPTIEAR